MSDLLCAFVMVSWMSCVFCFFCHRWTARNDSSVHVAHVVELTIKTLTHYVTMTGSLLPVLQAQTEPQSRMNPKLDMRHRIKLRWCDDKMINKRDIVNNLCMMPSYQCCSVLVRSKSCEIKVISSLNYKKKKNAAQIGSLFSAPAASALQYEQTIDWQVDTGRLFQFHKSIQIKPPPGIKASAIPNQERPNDRKWKLWLGKDEGFSSFYWICK